MIISEQDAQWAADEFIQYFSHMGNIEDYLRFVKKEVIKNSNSIVPLHDEFFNEDIHPEDMDFDIKFVGDRFQQALPQEHYNTLLKVVSSHNNESNIPGRELRWIIFERNTKKVLGFIRFGSPVINSKPRNLWLGKQQVQLIKKSFVLMENIVLPLILFLCVLVGSLLCLFNTVGVSLTKHSFHSFLSISFPTFLS